jgi:molybdopterin-guanine dinucleotide biosynthesis protein MobB
MSIFHPFEIAVCGYSGSGKTTLVSRLINHFASNYRVGYVKHSGHDFDMDHKAKDTSKARDAGAHRVFITNDAKTAMTTSQPADFIQQRTAFDDCDFVLAEGWRHAGLPKIVIVDEAGAILDELGDADQGPVIAFVADPATLPGRAPGFSRDDIEGIAGVILDHLQARTAATPLYGLVLAGGRSRRMQRDKASLVYAGSTQLEVAYERLAAVTSETYVSAREGQWETGDFDRLAQLHDRFIDCGPSGGILTALRTHPDAAWLVLACDLPFLDAKTLEELIAQRNPLKVATAYISANDGLPEPLCAIYEPRAYARLLQFMALGFTCPRKALIHSNVELLALGNPRALDNVNLPGEYEAAAAELGQSAR